MEIFDRTLGRSGREVLYRPIEFERYRKPHVVEYPRHAIVLNPHHTREQRERQQQASSSSDEDNEEGSSRSDDDGSDEDGDPWRADRNAFLCSDTALKQAMHLRWPSVGAVGIGLYNMGNTCFANSVLQAIAYTPALAQYFATTFKAADAQLGAPFDFAFALGEVVRQVHLGRSGTQRAERGAAYRPTPVVGHLRALSKHFSIGKQSDAHEFAVQLLHACQRSVLFRLVGSKKLPPAVAQTTALSRICGGYLRSQVSWSRRDEIAQLTSAGKRQEAMDLKLAGQHQRKGKHGQPPVDTDRLVSNTYDPCVIINVEIAGTRLEHCLERFCEVEKLDGRCYLSPRDANVRATKQFTIHVPPNVLIIQLKRFTATGGKVGKHVQFQKTLDITPFCSETAVARAGGARYTYELNAVCVHEGRSLNYGHYYAVVRARNGAWYECNDAHVSTLSEDAVMRLPAYMLFYSRVPVKVTTAKTQPASGGASAGFAPSHSHPPREHPAGPRLTATPMSMEAELGRGLTDEEVAALLERRAKQRQAQQSSQEEKDDTRQSAQQRRSALKRAREALPTDSDDDMGGGNDDEESGDDTHEPLPSAHLTHTNAVASPTSGSATPAAQAVKKGRYGGIIKAMTYHRPPTTQSDGAGSAKVYRVGRQAVSSIQHAVADSTPGTVRRPSHAPMFQQKMRDVLWEMEMDKGRVKKVKTRRGEEGSAASTHDGPQGNRFQQAGQGKFDVRGRPLRKGDE